MAKNDLKEWSQIFKMFSNINRLKIVRMLDGKAMTVTDIAWELKISLKSTSKHLIMMESSGILTSQGKAGHVYYSWNLEPARQIQRVISLIS